MAIIYQPECFFFFTRVILKVSKKADKRYEIRTGIRQNAQHRGHLLLRVHMSYLVCLSLCSSTFQSFLIIPYFKHPYKPREYLSCSSLQPFLLTKPINYFISALIYLEKLWQTNSSYGLRNGLLYYCTGIREGKKVWN